MKSDFLLAWVVPALLGAVIGYITNWLAIKMLFRPLKETRLFGLRLPFTPGLLPREKARLARSIGETVSRELLTEDVIKKRLAEPELRQALEKAVAERLEELFAAEAGGLVEALGAAREGELASLAAEAWRGLLRSEAFALALGASLRSALLSLEELPLSRLLPPERARELASLLLSSESLEGLKRGLAALIEKIFEGRGLLPGPGSESESLGGAGGSEGLSEGEGFLFGLLPAEALEPLLRVLVEGLYRAALPVIEGFMRSPEMRLGLERSALEIVRRAIGRLNLVQRLIVGAAQYERSLAESMPATVEDLLSALSGLLRSAAMPKRAADAAAEALQDAVRQGASSLVKRLLAKEASLAAAGAALDALRDHGPALVERAAELAALQPELKLGGALKRLGLPAEELSRRAAAAISALLSGEGAGSSLLAESAAAFASSLALALRGISLGQLLGAQGDYRRRLASWAAERSIALLSSEAGRIIEGLDVERIVVDKIESLDMLEIERIILSVVDKELRWITILGGFLGGLIGFLQSLLYLIT